MMKTSLILFICSLITSFIILNPSVRDFTQNLLVKNQRQILSQMDFSQGGQEYKVVKIKDPQGLSLELYKKVEGALLLTDSAQLTDKKDAHYRFEESNKHNLFLKDINGDGEHEIIAPSIDKNLKARLNIFRFDPVDEKLIKLTQH
jgi:hypothetical protein